MRRTLVFGSVLAGLCATAVAQSQNLIGNGDFEAGRGGELAGWSKPDGITSFWSPTGGHPGKCVRFKTDVLQRAKHDLLDGKPVDQVAAKPGGKYSTVGAHEGVWLFSQPVVVGPNDRYFILEADVKGPARSTRVFYPQVFVRGYQKYSRQRHGETSAYFQTPHEGGPAYSEEFGKSQRPARDGDLLMVYRHGLVCRLEQAGVWQHFQLAFRIPAMARYQPDVLLIKPYAMWPLGEYFFDNVTLRRVSAEEFAAQRRKGHTAKGF